MSSVRLSGIRVVVFDLDDTLYPERSFAFGGFEAVAKWLTKRMACSFDPAKRMRELFETDDRRKVFDRLLGELGRQDSSALIQPMVDCYRAHKPTIHLYEDAEMVIRQWRGLFKLGLISDGPVAVQQHKIDALALAGRLDRIILTDRWGQSFWKPHLRAFEAIEDEFGAQGSACLYLADNAEKDFITPRKLGWQTVRIRRPDGIYTNTIPPSGAEPDSEVTSLTQIDLSS